MNIPPIFIDENPQEEVEIFFRSLHNKNYPWMRNMILGFDDFQPLRAALKTKDIENKEQEKQIIGDFLKRCRDKSREQIQVFIEYSKQELKNKSEGALKQLALLMDYQWTENFPGYRVVPVLLPFSPFGKNVFFFSILRAAQGREQKDVLDISVHEISHMMLFDLLENYDLGKSNFQGSINFSIEYLKEIIAPVLMNQPHLRKLLNLSQYSNGYKGNTELEQVYLIEDGSNEKVQISEHFQKIYEKLRYGENKTFPEILKEMINIIKPLEGDLLKKRDMWNKYQFKIFEDEELLKSYSKPIKIQRVL